MSLLKYLIVAVFMPEKCYDELFINFNMHVPCLVFLINKLARFGIFMEMFFEPLPQLLKMLRNKSAEGLSLTYVLLQLYVFTCPIMFAKANNFPFYAWGDRLFSLIPAAVILLLVLHYQGDSIKGFKFLFGFGAWMTLLPSFAPLKLVSWMYRTSWMVSIVSKLIQTVANYRNGHAGQLSGCSMLLSCGGSLGFLFISLQGPDGFLYSSPYILSSCLSIIMLFQVFRSNSTSHWDSRGGTPVDTRSINGVDSRRRIKEEGLKIKKQ